MDEGYAEALKRIEAAQENWDSILDLPELNLASLPSEIAQLTSLEILELGNNQLSTLPPEIGQLINLRYLLLNNNQLRNLPTEISQLTNLNLIDFGNNKLHNLPSEIGYFKNLEKFYIYHNQLRYLPAEISYLINLQHLSIFSNLLSTLPPEIGQLTNLQQLNLHYNQLTTLPPEIGQLTNLQSLDLGGNQLSTLPSEIAQLTNLQSLDLDGNRLSTLPPEIVQLTNLQSLDLTNNQLSTLPPEIAQLTNLQSLDLDGNRLSTLPPEITQLTSLQQLNLNRNQLSTLPPEIFQLTNLQTLGISFNNLSILPPEIGHLTNLETLELDGNPLIFPPPVIIDEGCEAIVSFLGAVLAASVRVWRSKVLVVGEGGVGKTSLIKHLLGESYTPQDTTHGIDIYDVSMSHPDHDNVTMTLNTWDFGGQEIYHATHQFFYSNQSLFLLAWNARLGYEAGKLDYWLDTIHNLAPESPILLVATFSDQRDADLPLADLQRKYPKIIGQIEISNTEGNGIEKLRSEVARLAADLPFMGAIWPESWFNAAEAIRAVNKIHCSPQELIDLVVGLDAEHPISETQAGYLINALHALGDLLYFEENPELRDIVLLNPSWVSQQISNALEDETVVANDGVFRHEQMAFIWQDVEPHLWETLLKLMQQFDLSYIIPDDPDNRSIIVERLRHAADPRYAGVWDEQGGQPELTMRFRLPNSSLPAGIPTWFIARSHRFTLNIHWRTGALFRDKSQQHYALVRAYNQERYIELSVRGPEPDNFLNLLRDGLDWTLERFEGLTVNRKIPCPGHDGEPCPYEFDLDTVSKAIRKGIQTLRCDETLDEVEVALLRYGLRWQKTEIEVSKQLIAETENRIIAKIEAEGTSTRDLIQQDIELLQRGFLTLFHAAQSNIDLQCPNVFTLEPADQARWRNAFEQPLQLQLYCQMPNAMHPPIKNGKVAGTYTIQQSAEWLANLRPYINKMVRILKFVKPFVAPWMNLGHPEDYVKSVEVQLQLMESLTDEMKFLPEALQAKAARDVYEDSVIEDENKFRTEGADLRVLRQLLDELDPQHVWGGLRPILTPEGHYLWLCDHHAKEYLEFAGNAFPLLGDIE